ncbi:site-specific integrase [Flavobacterium soyangense]|uniref:Site-specific integrase n=1 Tax=Flavobacterium soyangense TaxID=2023265 RepID=A0A930XZV8_9FLAO|nr:site-specific integrase [Flavobacterium soyangense]MBF2709308.1 site-specific integrase [Flavobacterium soyangense]
MNNYKISILFLIQKSKVNKQGKCPIRCRITFNEGRQEFATGLLINPNTWFSKLQLTKPPNEENNFVNAQLSLIKSKINQAFLYLQMKNDVFSVDDIYSQFKGVKTKKEFGIIEVYNMYNERIKKLVDIEIKLVTYKKYIESRNHLLGFVKWKFKSNDFKLKDLKFNFITDYEYYLKTEKNLQQSTLNKAIQRFRKVLQYAISQDYLDKDPFGIYKPLKVKKEVIYLSVLELSNLEKQNFSQIRLSNVQDLFIFCCYTGLAFNEMAHLEKQHIQIGFDGINWIKMKREKTQRLISIPILPKAQEIIEKYSTESHRIFLPISNQKFNSYLKEIADITGIEKKLTHHIARKTFASTVLLYNDVPMEIVSELLGHSNMTITQESYGKIVQKKVSEAIKTLSKKLK